MPQQASLVDFPNSTRVSFALEIETKLNFTIGDLFLPLSFFCHFLPPVQQYVKHLSWAPRFLCVPFQLYLTTTLSMNSSSGQTMPFTVPVKLCVSLLCCLSAARLASVPALKLDSSPQIPSELLPDKVVRTTEPRASLPLLVSVVLYILPAIWRSSVGESVSSPCWSG